MVCFKVVYVRTSGDLRLHNCLGAEAKHGDWRPGSRHVWLGACD
jgi:hypothetical protein